MFLVCHLNFVLLLKVDIGSSKKVFHKNEEKMQEKMKMISQKNKSLVHVQHVNSNMVFLFAKELIPNLDFSSRYGIINV